MNPMSCKYILIPNGILFIFNRSMEFDLYKKSKLNITCENNVILLHFKNYILILNDDIINYLETSISGTKNFSFFVSETNDSLYEINIKGEHNFDLKECIELISLYHFKKTIALQIINLSKEGGPQK